MADAEPRTTAPTRRPEPGPSDGRPRLPDSVMMSTQRLPSSVEGRRSYMISRAKPDPARPIIACQGQHPPPIFGPSPPQRPPNSTQTTKHCGARQCSPRVRSQPGNNREEGCELGPGHQGRVGLAWFLVATERVPEALLPVSRPDLAYMTVGGPESCSVHVTSVPTGINPTGSDWLPDCRPTDAEHHALRPPRAYRPGPTRATEHSTRRASVATVLARN